MRAFVVASEIYIRTSVRYCRAKTLILYALNYEIEDKN